jgi:membrane-associated HD superfamily phosphohydrolase
MPPINTENTSLFPWKHFILITTESLLTFYIATFCVAMYFTHRGPDWVFQGIILGILYAFVIFACGKRVVQNLPISALMLIIPIAPLIALIIVISLIPILEKF